MRPKILFFVAAIACAAVFVGAHIFTSIALVPTIVSVSPRDVGTTAWVDIVVSHVPPPALGPSHYVSNVQLDINGTTVDLPQQPQTTETFTVEYSLGPNTDRYTVAARALCTVHGYSAFSSSAVIPEFPTGALVVLAAALTAALVLFRKKMLGKSGKN